MCVYTVCIREEKESEKKQHTEIMYNIIIRNHFNYDAGEEKTHAHATRRRRRRKNSGPKIIVSFAFFYYIFMVDDRKIKRNKCISGV